MTGYSVVFDTNIYRSVKPDRIAAIRTKELGLQVQPRATYFTVLELCAHLADPADPDARACLAAVKKLWQHCHVACANGLLLPFVADGEAQLFREIFGAMLPNRLSAAASDSAAVEQLVSIPTPADIPADLRKVMEGFRSHRDTVERDFAADMAGAAACLGALAGMLTPASASTPNGLQALLHSNSFTDHICSALVDKAASETSTPLSPRDRNRHIASVARTRAAAVEFFRDKLANGAAPRANLTKGVHVNSVWDFQLALMINKNYAINGQRHVFITNENAIIRAAERAGHRDAVANLGEYERMLTQSPP